MKVKKGFQTTKEIKKEDLLARTSGEGDPDPAISDQERGSCYGLNLKSLHKLMFEYLIPSLVALCGKAVKV